jgi:glycerol-3-phosphate dehydrogenase
VPRWKLGAGLLLYDVLSLFRNRRHERLDARAVHASEPRCATEALMAARATGTRRRTTCG